MTAANSSDGSNLSGARGFWGLLKMGRSPAGWRSDDGRVNGRPRTDAGIAPFAAFCVRTVKAEKKAITMRMAVDARWCRRAIGNLERVVRREPKVVWNFGRGIGGAEVRAMIETTNE